MPSHKPSLEMDLVSGASNINETSMAVVVAKALAAIAEPIWLGEQLLIHN